MVIYEKEHPFKNLNRMKNRVHDSFGKFIIGNHLRKTVCPRKARKARKARNKSHYCIVTRIHLLDNDIQPGSLLNFFVPFVLFVDSA